jgi:hypothetical protein
MSDDHKAMVTVLKELVYHAIPDIKEKLSWNVPFFYKKKTICFIWPGSIPWGKKTKNGVEFGFTKGYLMKPNSYLEKGNRKQIHLKTYYTVDQIEADSEIIIELLKEADALDI